MSKKDFIDNFDLDNIKFNEDLEHYTLKKPVIMLGLDPGKENFGWNIVAARDLGDYVSLDSGNILSVASQISEVTPTFLQSLVEEAMSLLLLSEAEYLCIERYHPRGNNALVGVEYVNNMIGSILISCANLPHVTVCPFTASSWKPRVYSDWDWDHNDWFPDAFNIHAADAGSMSLSHLYQLNVLPWEGKFYNGVTIEEIIEKRKNND